MRRLGLIVAITGSCAGLPATAQSVTSPAVPTSVARTPLLQPLALGSSVENTRRLSGKLRLRVAVTATAQSPRDHIHQRISSSMIDFYPVGASGLHVSAGTRMYDLRAGEAAANRALFATARAPDVPGAKAGLKRTPALTIGYTGDMGGGARVGVEVGAMKGSAYADVTDLARQTRAERAGNRGPVNPMVNLVVGRRF